MFINPTTNKRHGKNAWYLTLQWTASDEQRTTENQHVNDAYTCAMKFSSNEEYIHVILSFKVFHCFCFKFLDSGIRYPDHVCAFIIYQRQYNVQ